MQLVASLQCVSGSNPLLKVVAIEDVLLAHISHAGIFSLREVVDSSIESGEDVFIHVFLLVERRLNVVKPLKSL